MDDMFRLAVEACPAAMIMVGPDGTIELVNAECERMFGYARGRLIGSPIENLTPERVRGGHRALRASFAEQPSKRLMGIGRDLRALRSDGSEFPVEIGLTPVATPKGLGVLSFVIDISARREAEKSIAAAMAELERANEGLARFAYVASHDIQEPLRKIVAFADLLQTAIAEGDREEIAYAGEVIQASARHARVLVSDLLSLARSMNSDYRLEPISIRAVVDGALTDLSQTIVDEHAKLDLDLEDFTIDADRSQAIRLAQNLVSNALKYHKPGEPPIIRIAARAAPRRLSVEDHGIGFALAHRDDIFEPFKRLHSRDDYPGSGIGLAICKTIAGRHGWSIAASSTPNVGSLFELGFDPADAALSHRAAQGPSKGP